MDVRRTEHYIGIRNWLQKKKSIKSHKYIKVTFNIATSPHQPEVNFSVLSFCLYIDELLEFINNLKTL